MAEFWNRHDPVSRAAMMTELAPLVAASRTKTFTVDEARAYMISLVDVPPAVLNEAVLAMVGRGITWMPKPGELKKECARIVGLKRKAASDLHLKDCPHPGHYIEVEIDGVMRAKRCEHWDGAQRAMDAVGAAIALPPADDTEPRDSQVW